MGHTSLSNVNHRFYNVSGQPLHFFPIHQPIKVDRWQRTTVTHILMNGKIPIFEFMTSILLWLKPTPLYFLGVFSFFMKFASIILFFLQNVCVFFCSKRKGVFGSCFFSIFNSIAHINQIINQIGFTFGIFFYLHSLSMIYIIFKTNWSI